MYNLGVFGILPKMEEIEDAISINANRTTFGRRVGSVTGWMNELFRYLLDLSVALLNPRVVVALCIAAGSLSLSTLTLDVLAVLSGTARLTRILLRDLVLRYIRAIRRRLCSIGSSTGPFARRDASAIDRIGGCMLPSSVMRRRVCHLFARSVSRGWLEQVCSRGLCELRGGRPLSLC